MLQPDEIGRLVSRGEGLILEFKRKTPEPARISKEVIAFANSRGGKVLIGVDDDGTIVGVKDSAEEEYAVRQALDLWCLPPVMYRCERVPVTSKREVIVVSVPASRVKPHRLFDPNVPKEQGRAYVRVDDMSLEASEESIALMKAENIPDDVHFNFGHDELMVMRFLEQYGRITVREFGRLSDQPPDQARETLVTLARARVLVFHTAPDEDYFTLMYPDSN